MTVAPHHKGAWQDKALNERWEVFNVNPETEFPVYRVIDQDGQLVGERSGITNHQLKEFYRWLVTLRTLDQRAWNLQRQGRIGTYAPFSGQEAAQIGVAATLRPTDWICPSYRDWPVLAYLGTPLHYPLLGSMGHPEAGHIPDEIPSLPAQVVIAAQILHAVGLAWSAKLQRQDRIAVTFFGDGATSQGDFHEALNLASVMKVPVIFVAQNNQWAISVPVHRQMNTPTIAQRALAYNVEGIRVDGNDIAAVYQTFMDLQKRVREGSGPALVEAVTYRLGAHTTADDPTRYRIGDDDTPFRRGEPVARLRRYLENEHILSPSDFEAMDQDAKIVVDKAVETAEAYPKNPPETIFDHVYAELTPQLVRQRQEFAQHLSDGGDIHG